MTVEEEKKLLAAFFDVVDHVNTLHLTGGGEPFLHPQLAAMVEEAMKYQNQFERLMLFTNSLPKITDELLETLERYKDKILVQLSQYGIYPEREQAAAKCLMDRGIRCKIEKYYGEEQSFGGWIDFGSWDVRNRDPETLTEIFHQCSVTRVLGGNWRTRNGKVHWCSRSMRGMELGLIPDEPRDYVDLFDDTSREEKQKKFQEIAERAYISVCDRCSGDLVNLDKGKRYPAAEQIKRV